MNRIRRFILLMVLALSFLMAGEAKAQLVAISANTNLTCGSQVVQVNTGASQLVLGLPTAVCMPSQTITVFKGASLPGTTGNVAITPNGSQTINGSTTPLILTNQFDYAILLSDGSNWYLLSGVPVGSIVSGSNVTFPGTVISTGATSGPCPTTMTDTGIFGSKMVYTCSGCELNFGPTNVNTVSATTTTGATCLPTGAIIDAVVYRITATITTAANFTVGYTAALTRFCGTQSTLTIGTTGSCLAQWNAGTPQNACGTCAVVVTFNATPGAGAMRLIVYSHQPTPPTS